MILGQSRWEKVNFPENYLISVQSPTSTKLSTHQFSNSERTHSYQGRCPKNCKTRMLITVDITTELEVGLDALIASSDHNLSKYEYKWEIKNRCPIKSGSNYLVAIFCPKLMTLNYWRNPIIVSVRILIKSLSSIYVTDAVESRSYDTAKKFSGASLDPPTFHESVESKIRYYFWNSTSRRNSTFSSH